MADEGFTMVQRTVGAPSKTGPVRRNVALFARHGTKDAKGRMHYRIKGLMVVLESVLSRDSKGKPVRSEDGKLKYFSSAGLPGGSNEELPDDAVSELLKAYTGGAKVQMHSPFTPAYARREDEVTHEYLIATVDCEASGTLPTLERPEGCPDALWVTWKDVSEEHARDKRGVLRSLFVLYMSIIWTQGKVPEIVRGWVVDTRPPLPKSKAKADK